MKLKATALLYALMFSLLVGSLLTALVYARYFREQENHLFITEYRLESNLKSAAAIAFAQKQFGHFELDLFEQGHDSVSYHLKPWGAFGLLNCTAFDKTFSDSLTYLIGNYANDHERVLYCTNKGHELTLAGESFIQGTAYVPFGKLKRHNSGHLSFKGRKLFDGIIDTSNHHLPSEIVMLKDSLIKRLFDLNDLQSIAYDKLTLAPHPHNEPRKILFATSSDSLVLENDTIEGFYFLAHNGPIFIRKSMSLEHVIIHADKVYIEEGFSGNAQIYARNYIEVGENVVLSYPSILSIIEPTGDTPLLKVNEGSKILGGILVTSQRFEPTQCMIENARIKGFIWSDAAVQVSGIVQGEILVSEFSLNLSSSVHSNMMYNLIVDRPPDMHEYLFPYLLHSEKLTGVIWEN